MSAPVGESLGDWTPPPPPGKPVLAGRYVTVQPLDPDAFDDLWDSLVGGGADLWTYMGYGPFETPEELQETLEPWLESSDPLFFTFNVDGMALGWGAYLRIKPEHGAVEVGHLAFSPGLQQTRAATEAMYLMMRHVFDLGYRRYEWKCDSLNAASRRAAERLGFRFEGVFRSHMVSKGRNRDTAWYAMTDADWPAARDALEAWLDPANFDSAGHQLHPLS